LNPNKRNRPCIFEVEKPVLVDFASLFHVHCPVTSAFSLVLAREKGRECGKDEDERSEGVKLNRSSLKDLHG